MSNLLEQASLVLIPSGYKEDVVYSEIPLDGSGDMNFTRSSNGTRINSAGLVEVCPWNLLEQSEQFNASPWVLDTGGGTGSITVTNNYATAPNGTLTADRIQMVRGTVYAQTFQPLPVISGAQYTLSVYLKSLSGTPTISTLVGGSVSSQKTLTTEWVKYELTFNASSSTIYPLIALYGGDSATADILAWGYQVNIGATAKPYFPTTDRLNVPRLTYQNGGGGCPSLLLEKQSTNQLTYSQDFTQTSWTKTAGLSVTGNTTISPDGTQNAGTITNTATANCVLFQLASTSATTWTISFYAKKGTNKYLGVSFCSATYQSTSRYQPVFNLDNGTLQTINQSGSNQTNTSYSITAVGDGWYRLTATATFAAGADQCYIVLQSSNNTSYTPASGNLDWTTPTTGNYYLYGAQVEASSYPTSYIPTTSASATRVADACGKTGISSLIGQTEGVMFAEINVPSIATAGNYSSWQLNDGSTSNLIDFTYYSTGRIQAIAFIGGSLQVNIDFPSFGLTAGNHKIAFAYKLNDYVLYVDGVQVGSDTSAQVPAMSKCDLFAGLNQITVYKQFVLFPTRLSNSELASLTTL